MLNISVFVPIIPFMLSCFVVFCRVYVRCCGIPAVFDEYVVVDYILYMSNLTCTTLAQSCFEVHHNGGTRFVSVGTTVRNMTV